MVSETSDVLNFLSHQALFQHLSPEVLEQVCSNSFTAFKKSGSTLNLEPAETAIGLMVVRSGSLEIRTGSGELLDRLSAGDFLLPLVLRNLRDSFQITVLEDCLYYEIRQTLFESLRNSDRDIHYLCESYGRRFSSDDSEPLVDAGPSLSLRNSFLGQPVADYMSSPIVSIAPTASVREAAQLMKAHKISSLLITENEQLAGIVTDRDFRTRVLAEGVADTTPIAEVMTSNPRSVPPNCQLHQAQLLMMSATIHHLPVVENQRPVGMLGLSDIMRANNLEPVSLIRAIHNAASADALAEVARQFPVLVTKLIERDTRAVDVGEIITTLTDGLNRRLLQLAEAALGAPPCDYAWLAFGSQARQEQVLGSDQDNALILGENYQPEHEDYFRELAERVNDGLNRCGIELCPGDIMAKNSKWRMTLPGWLECFRQWIEQPSPKALMHASIFFDMRYIAGNDELPRQLQADVLQRAKKNTIFQALMCDNALHHSPPLGFFKTFVLERDGDHIKSLELKKRGTIPIVDIARNYALHAGLPEVSTQSRLMALEQAGVMSRSLVSSLIDAHEFIAGIRLESQAAEFRRGETVDNLVDPSTLSPLMRHQLKEAFHLVRQAQTVMKSRFGRGAI